MNVAEDVATVGVQPATQRATGAVVLALLSRLTVVILVLSVAWAAVIARSVGVDDRARIESGSMPSQPTDAEAGMSIGALLDDLRERTGRAGGDVVDIEMVREAGPTALVTLTADVTRGTAAGVDRFIASLRSSRLRDVSARSVDPLPTGLRVTVRGRITVAAFGTEGTFVDDGATAVLLAQAAERAGVELRAVGIPERERDPIRMAVTGDLASIARLVGDIEDRYSAPLRFRSVSIRRVELEVYEAAMLFALREDAIGLHPEVAP